MIPEYFKIKTAPEQVWKEYQRCKSFNDSINLYETVKLNERFVSGDQWRGVKAPDIDKPVLNFLNRVVMYEVALIVSDNIGISISAQHDQDNPYNQAIAKSLEKYVEDVIEDTSFTSLTRENVRDAAVDGDAALYAYWDAEKNKVAVEAVANTSVLFGNPNVTLVQDQPYIIIEQARNLTDVKWQAWKDGVEDWEMIKPDDETMYRQSDVDYTNANTVTVLKKFWRDLETGHIWFTECTRNVTLREAVDTELMLYPVAWMNWEKVKENYHGKAIITGLIDNQIAVNRLWAGALWHLRQLAFPKVFYDRAKFPQGWDNRPGASYAVAGGLTDQVATAFQSPKMDSDVVAIVDKTISLTRDFMGVNDTVLGNINPSNTSAIIAVQKSTAAPLELQKLAFYQFVEDIVRVIVDLLLANLGERKVEITIAAPDPVTGQVFEQKGTAIVNFDLLNYDLLKLKVDVGEAAYWSELTQVQTMDNLFEKGLITDALTYLESIPDKLLPHKNEIIEKYKAQTQGSDVKVTGAKDLTEDSLASAPEHLVNRREEQMTNEMQRV